MGVHKAGHNLASGGLHNESRSPCSSAGLPRRIDAALEAVRSVRLQPEGFGRFADGNGLEVGTLEKEVRRSLGDLGVRAAHHARHCDGLLGVANEQCALGQLAFFAVQRGDGLPFRAAPHDDFPTRDKVVIEGVKRLAEFVEDEVGHVHHVVDGPQADGRQPIPQPILRRPHFHAADHHADIARATFCVFDLDGNLFGGLSSRFDRRNLGQFERLLRQRGQVAGHADVARGVGAVGGDGEVQHGVAFRLARGLQILRKWLPDLRRFIQHEDALVIVTQAQFVLRTNHPLRDLTPQRRLFDLHRHALSRALP